MRRKHIRRFLNRVWGSVEAYVCISLKTKRGKWRDVMFRWPGQRAEILSLVINEVEAHSDLYFSPVMYSKAKRRKRFAIDTNLCWSDLDEADPEEIPKRPTIAWRSSDGRYQCLWVLSDYVEPHVAEGISKRLAYDYGADPGGWDITQVLRIPHTLNHKYEPPPTVKLLWTDGPRYNVGTRPKRLETPDESPPAVAEPLPIHRVKQLSERLPVTIQELMAQNVKRGDRSSALWRLECMLAKETQLSPTEIFSLIHYLPWNKFRDRPGQLYNEVMKAIEQERGSSMAPVIHWYNELMEKDLPPPRWLIEGIWGDENNGILAGEPKSYKTTLALDMAISVASGEPFLGHYPVINPGPVLFVQEENSVWAMRDRLLRISQAKRLVGSVQLSNGILTVEPGRELEIAMVNNYGFDLSNKPHQDILSELMDRIRPRIVFFDSLYLLLGERDENVAKDLRSVLLFLLGLRNTFHSAVCMIHHWRKSQVKVRGGQRLLGSVTLHAWLEAGIYIEVDPNEEGKLIVEREFRNFAKLPEFEVSLELGEDYKVTTAEDFGSRIITYLANEGPSTTNQLAKDLDTSWRKVQRWMKRLGDQVIRQGKEWDLNV